ncbi:MAG: hypothetical protein M4579_001297 [Chaenotheca gracillima]|nr:MAG: hypothetical protein M4579_001297 [Chaenotheca gracillima]
MPRLSLLLGVWLTITTAAQGTTTCLQNQPRAQDAPSELAISEALQKVLSRSLNGPCSGTFPTLPNGSKGNRLRLSTGSLKLEVLRDNASAPIDYSCVNAFNTIIYECIGIANKWGGVVTSNGVTYSIFNQAYPANWNPSTTSTTIIHAATGRLRDEHRSSSTTSTILRGVASTTSTSLLDGGPTPGLPPPVVPPKPNTTPPAPAPPMEAARRRVLLTLQARKTNVEPASLQLAAAPLAFNASQYAAEVI